MMLPAGSLEADALPPLPGYRLATSWLHYTTSCNTQSGAPEDGWNPGPKHVELIGSINNPLLLHLFGCLYYIKCKICETSHYVIFYICFVLHLGEPNIFFSNIFSSIINIWLIKILEYRLHTLYQSASLNLSATCVLYIRTGVSLLSRERFIYILNQQIYFIIWYLLDRASLI